MNIADLALPAAGDRFRLERDTEAISIVRLSDEAPVGRFELELADDGFFVRALCIHEPHRGYGAGSEAVLLLNGACDDANVPLVRAWAPPDRGLAVYFWIRMGFHPLQGEGPEGGLLFERRRNE